MASVKQYRDHWRAQVYVLGVRDSKCLRTKREAESWAAARETEIRREKNKPAAEKITVGGVLRRYALEVSPTKRGAIWERIRLNALERMEYFPADILIGSVTTTHFAEWRDKRSKEVAPGTVRREISLLSSVLETARKEWRLIDANPLSDIKKPRQPEHRDVVLGRWQIRNLLKALDWQSGPCKSTKQAVGRALLLALRTGMRAGELCGLSWANVKEDYCILPVTKTKPRNVPLAPKARSIVERMRGWDRHLVFGVKSQTLDATFRKAKAAAGIDGVTFHDSRHTAATWLAQKIDVLDLCKMFGWSNPNMAMVYYNPTASDIAKRLSAPSPGQRSRSVSGRNRLV